MFARIFYETIDFSAVQQFLALKQESLKCNHLPSTCQQFSDLLKAQKSVHCPVVTEKSTRSEQTVLINAFWRQVLDLQTSTEMQHRFPQTSRFTAK